MGSSNDIRIEIHKSDYRGNIFRLVDPLFEVWRQKYINIPAGFESDGVSTPQILWATISPAVDPRTLRAGICHDWIYREQPKGWTRAEADAMFYDFIREDGLNWWRARKAYWGLRLFGWKAWEDNYDKR